MSDFAEEKHPFFVLQFNQMFSRWTVPFYFAAQRLGNPFNEIAQFLFEKVIEIGMNQVCSPELDMAIYGADLLTVAFGWDAESPGPIRGSKQLHALYGLYKEGRFEPEVEFRIGMLFSSFVGLKHGLTTSMEAATVLENFPDRPIGSQRLQLLVAIANGDILQGSAYVQLLKGAILEYRIYLIKNTLPGIDIGSYDSGRTFAEIAFYIRNLFESHQYDVALDLIQAWKGLFWNETIIKNVIICLPDHPRGVSYVTPIKAHFPHLEHKESLDKFRSLLDASNRSLGDTHQSLHDEDFHLHSPDRMGVLDYQHGRAFEASMRDSYLSGEAPDFLKSESENSSGIAFIPYFNHPIQALMIKDLAVSLPYISSWITPLPDKKILKALIYQDELHTAKFESDELVRILSGAGIACHVILASESGWTDFKKLYASDEFDLIWVIGHGEFDHMKPHDTHLGAPQSGDVLVDKLASVNVPSSARRLLVLNICSGGIGAAIGGLPEFSIGHALTSSGQAVISHLWPVLHFYPVYFGVLLALELAKGSCHFDAYTKAMSSFVHTDRTGMIDLQEAGIAADLIERFDRSEMDWANILHWGSPVFLQ